ncbi:MAG TPA: hypothetical protein VHG91_07060 [Longimicrobium sp.]|nr:hypothetical protein [Longimicrobium sp.]
MRVSTQQQQGPRLMPRARLAVVALLALAAACADDGVSPAARIRAESAAVHSRGNPHLVSNAVKYRDSGAPHATGRSGTARLAARALVDSLGRTRLVVTTGDLDDTASAPGRIVKIQLKAWAPDGTFLGTRNFNGLTGGGTWVSDLPGVGHGARIQVQGNVRGIDGRRTDVVTITETVKAAPRLDVALDAPERVLPGAPIPLVAVVTEVGGDVGARTDCVLYVNGHAVDSAKGIWVDAGDAVSCAFTYVFGPGDHTVQVRLEGGATGESPVARVRAEVSNTATFDASAEDRTVEATRLMEYHWERPDGVRKEYRNLEQDSERSQRVTVNGSLPRAAVWPLASVSLEMESGGTVWQESAWALVGGVFDPATGLTCATQPVLSPGSMFHLCSSATATTFGYTRFAGTVTYHSDGFARQWDGAGARTNNYEWNDTWTTHVTGSGHMRQWGADVRVRIEVTDADGTFGGTPVMTLQPFEEILSTTPRSCTLEYHYWLEGNAQETCTSGSAREFGRRGDAEG